MYLRYSTSSNWSGVELLEDLFERPLEDLLDHIPRVSVWMSLPSRMQRPHAITEESGEQIRSGSSPLAELQGRRFPVYVPRATYRKSCAKAVAGLEEE